VYLSLLLFCICLLYADLSALRCTKCRISRDQSDHALLHLNIISTEYVLSVAARAFRRGGASCLFAPPEMCAQCDRSFQLGLYPTRSRLCLPIPVWATRARDFYPRSQNPTSSQSHRPIIIPLPSRPTGNRTDKLQLRVLANKVLQVKTILVIITLYICSPLDCLRLKVPRPAGGRPVRPHHFAPTNRKPVICDFLLVINSN